MTKVLTGSFAVAALLVLSGCGAQETAQEKMDTAAAKATEMANDAMDSAQVAAMEKAGEMAEEKMDEMKASATDAMHDAVDGMMGAGEATYTMEEIAMHNTREDCWTVINGSVADVTSFFGKHPGGDDNLAKACGVDATTMFESVKKHDPNGYAQLENHKIGTLAE